MSGTRNRWLTGLFLGAITLCSTAARAVGDAPELVLKRNGLEPVGPLFVLEGEREVKKKLTEVRQLSRQMNYARLQQTALGTPQEHQALIQQLNNQVAQIRAEINAVNRQMGRLPRIRGRMANNYVQAEQAELTAYRNQLNFELGQQNNMLGQVKSHPPDPKLKQKLDADAQAKTDEFHQAVQDLVQLVDTTREKYAKLAKDDEVKKALAAMELKVRPSPKLGPSHEFHETIKVVERLEKESGARQPSLDPAPKSSRKSRRAAAQPAP